MLRTNVTSQAENFSNEDFKFLAEHGISRAEAERQLELLLKPAYYAKLERACTDLDGILAIDSSRYPDYLALHEKAQAEGRFIKFVPASGAASRMFKDLMSVVEKEPPPTYDELIQLAQAGAKDAKAVIKFLANLSNFAFYESLQKLIDGDLNELKHSDRYIEIIKKLLLPEGLNYAALPKGLLPFHLYNGISRTAFEEHLVEAAHTVRDAQGNCRLHFTVSSEHQDDFQKLFEAVRGKYEAEFGVRFQISFSVQKPSTDTLALGADNKPFRGDDGRLMLRPGGHGSLIENLADLNADIIFIKNIDNVQPDRDKETVLKYKRILGGFLIEKQNKIFESLEKLHSGSLSENELESIYEFVRKDLKTNFDKALWQTLSPSEKQSELISRLNRPIRVCGMVRNTGEPGGGPFWVRQRDGSLSKQIVEGAQVDLSDPEQAKIFKESTHFNPVDIVASYRDFKGGSFDLGDYINEEAVIKTEKSYRGKPLIACERPGLWNGAMDGWITLFVDIPESTFTPVKTVLDLLRK